MSRNSSGVQFMGTSKTFSPSPASSSIALSTLVVGTRSAKVLSRRTNQLEVGAVLRPLPCSLLMPCSMTDLSTSAELCGALYQLCGYYIWLGSWCIHHDQVTTGRRPCSSHRRRGPCSLRSLTFTRRRPCCFEGSTVWVVLQGFK